MANVIKIKRSAATAAPTTLNEGELAFSYLSGKLYIGNSSAVIPIGGTHFPGVLTANQALVVNATSEIDKIIVANLVPTIITANGVLGTAGQALLSNSTGGVYWGQAASSLNDLTDVTISSAANNELLIYDAASNQWENHSVSGNSGQVNVAFASQDITVSLVPNVVVDTTLTVGNSTVNTSINSTAVSVNSFNASQITVGSNVTINTSAIFVGNSTVNTTIQAGNIALRGTQISIGPDLVIDGNTIIVGNSTVNTVINSSSISVDGEITSGNTNITGFINVSSTANIGGVVTARANVTVNGALLVANTADLGNTTITGILTIGNSTVNTFANSTTLNVGTTGTLVGHRFLSSNISLQAPNNGDYAGERLRFYDFGDSRVHYSMGVEGGHIWTAVDNSSNTIGFKWYGNTVLAARLGGTGTLEIKSDFYTDASVNANVSVKVGANVVANTSALLIGNSTVNTVVNSSSITTTTGSFGNVETTGYANIAGTLYAHGNVELGDSFGVDVTSFKSTVNTEISPSANNNYKLGRADLRWGEVNANNVLATNVAVDSIVTVGSNVSLSTGALSVGNSTVNTVVNSTSVSTGTLAVANLTVSGDLTVQGNTTLGTATSDVVSFVASVNTNIIPSANVTYSLGNNSLYWLEVHAANVHADYGYFNHDVAIYGDLTVSGNLVTTNVQSVVISDPLIQLADGNDTSDLVDIGFIGHYHTGGANLHTGLFRDATVDEYYLFKGLTQDLAGQLTVNVADPTFALADLNAWLQSGALISNSTAVTITANSTVNVNITANSLLLSTALTVNSGGTGLSSVTAKGILYGNTTGPLGITSAGTDGQVLQANSTGFPVFADLDGGTF